MLALAIAGAFAAPARAQNAFQSFMDRLAQPTAEERRRAQSGQTGKRTVRRDDEADVEVEEAPPKSKRTRRAAPASEQKPDRSKRRDATTESAKPPAPEKAPAKPAKAADRAPAKERLPFRRENEPDTGPPPAPERSPDTAGETFASDGPPPPMPVRNPIAAERPRPAPQIADPAPPAPGEDTRITEWRRTPGPTPPLPTPGKRGAQSGEAERLRLDRERERVEQEKAELEMIEAEQRRLELEEQKRAELEMIAREEAEMARTAMQKAGPDRPGPDGWSPEEIASAKERCNQALAHLAVKYKIQPPIRQGGCGAAVPILVSSIGSDPAIEISPPAVMNCTLASGLERWFREAVQPSARTYLGSPIVRVRNAAAYVCRGRNGSRSGKLSEHAFANALDISSFETASGGSIAVTEDWPKKMSSQVPAYGPLRRGVVPAANAEEMPSDRKGAFLVRTHRAACPVFGTVLGPAADAAHRSHFHVDMAKRRRSNFCQ